MISAKSYRNLNDKKQQKNDKKFYRKCTLKPITEIKTTNNLILMAFAVK